MNRRPLDLQSNALPLSYTPSVDLTLSHSPGASVCFASVASMSPFCFVCGLQSHSGLSDGHFLKCLSRSLKLVSELFFFNLFSRVKISRFRVLTLFGQSKITSFEPDLNQRPKDVRRNHYSPPLYQLSYRRGRTVPTELSKGTA